MDLATYSGLQAAVASYLNRDDLAAQIPAFIRLAEAKIARRLRRASVRTTLTISGARTVLPGEVAELRSLRLVTGQPHLDRPIHVGTYEQVADRLADTGGVAGRPTMAAVIDGTLHVAPAPDRPYTVEALYFSKLVPLSATLPANRVLHEAPDLYLYGALREAQPYLEHDERIPVWSAAFDGALAELNDAREREETNASLRPMRLPVVF